MHDLVLGDLKIDVDESAPGRLQLHWTGTSNSADPVKGLMPFLTLQLARAAKEGVLLELHFEALSYFNSSTIAAVIRFIHEARSRKLKLALFYNGSLRWQRLDFEAIAPLDTGDGLLRFERLDLGEPPESIKSKP